MATQSLQPATANELNQGFVALAMKHTQPKDMSETERDCHIAIRNLFRTFVEETGATSINKATPEQLKAAIQQTMVYVKNGAAYEPKKVKFPIAQQVVVACWGLRFEANVIAKAEEITVGRSIENYIIDNFDFEAHSGAQKETKSTGEKPVAAKKQPVEATPAVFGDWIERLDLLPQLEFHGADSPERVAELLEAWNQGGEFRLLVKRSTALAVKVSALDEQADRQTLVAFDVNGKKVGMAYMDKLAQYFTVVEKNA